MGHDKLNAPFKIFPATEDKLRQIRRNVHLNVKSNKRPRCKQKVRVFITNSKQLLHNKPLNRWKHELLKV